MKNKKEFSYIIQTNLESGFDIIESTKQNKIVGHTDNEQAAKDIINFLTANKIS